MKYISGRAIMSFPQAAFAGCFGHPSKAACGKLSERATFLKEFLRKF
jgi:hypothetical protein